MRSVVKQHLRHLSKEERVILQELCANARSLYNEALNNIWQYYRTEGECLNAADNCYMLKSSSNYKMFNSNMAQKLIKDLHEDVRPFFGAQGYATKFAPKLIPEDKYIGFAINFTRIKGNKLKIPVSFPFMKLHPKQDVVITVPPQIAAINEQDPKRIKEIRVVPIDNAKSFVLYYVYEAEEKSGKLSEKKALAIDLGVNNLITAVSSDGHSFIIDGKKLKSYNWWFNREYNKLEIIKEKQHHDAAPTARQKKLINDRNERITDYINKAASITIRYCLENHIGILVVGLNKVPYKDNESSKGEFRNIPFGKVRSRLEQLAKLYGIEYIKQDEAYTSDASFWDKDKIPKYAPENPQEYKFSGDRTHRGLYRCADGRRINADVNSALNILRKCNVVSLRRLYAKGEVDTPVRIRIE